MKVKNNCDLKSCYLCKHCIPAWIPAIEGNRKVIHIAKGEQLFKEGDVVEGMYFVFKGLVKVQKQWGQDKELILRFATAGDILGHRGLGADNTYPISATAVEASVVCFISINFFLDTLKVNQQFTLELLNFFASELKLSEQKMRNLAHMPVKGRIAQAFISFEEKFGLTGTGVLNIEISRQDLASYVGATYETTFRVLNELAEENLIQLDKKAIKIINKTALVELCKY